MNKMEEAYIEKKKPRDHREGIRFAQNSNCKPMYGNKTKQIDE